MGAAIGGFMGFLILAALLSLVTVYFLIWRFSRRSSQNKEL